MKILFFLAHSNSIGGAAKQIIAHARIAKAKGNIVKIVIQNDSRGNHTLKFDYLCQKYDLDYESCKYDVATCIEEIDFLQSYNDSRAIDIIVEEFKPDIIQYMQINLSVEISARKHKIPSLMSIYPISKGMFNISWLNTFSKYHCADSLLFCNQWADGLGIKTKCVRVAYETNHVCDKGKSNNLDKKNKLELISVGVFSFGKNQLEILKFIKLCKDNKIDIHVSFLGDNDGEYFAKCRKYIDDNALADKVSISGYVEEVEDYLLQSDLLIHASRIESFPGVIVEAMANRIPVISTPVAGVPELLKDKYNAFLTNGYTSDDLYHSFLEFLKFYEDGKLKSIVHNGYTTFENYNSFNTVQKELLEYYDEIVADSEICSEDCLEDVYRKMISFFNMHKLDKYSSYTQSHCWYLYHLKQNYSQYSTAYVWGTGKYASVGTEWCEVLGLEIIGFIDSYKEGEYMGYPIYAPDEEIIKGANCIIVAVANYNYIEQIMWKLERFGRVRNVDYFLICNNPCFVPWE